MDYAAAHAAAAPPPADPHPAYSYPYGYQYTYPTYHQPDPAAAGPSAIASSSSYYYPNPTAPADAQAQHNPYANTYHYYDPSAVPYGGGGGLADYYYGAGQASSQAPAASAAQAAPAQAAGKHFGFDPRRYAQVAAAKAPNGMAPEADATVMHHAQWNAHFGHPLPRNAPRKFIKKAPKVVQPLRCEVCKVECDTQDVLVIHKTGKKHKKNLQKLQDSITPKPAKPPAGAVVASAAPSGAVVASAAPAAAAVAGAVVASSAPAGVVAASAAPVAAVANGVMPARQPKKNKSSAATPADLEVKKRRVLEAGAAQSEVKTCTACNVVVNSLKVYEFHIAGHKHKANVRKQEQAQQLPHVA